MQSQQERAAEGLRMPAQRTIGKDLASVVGFMAIGGFAFLVLGPPDEQSSLEVALLWVASAAKP